ncbi:hypothetical protein DMNBHIDG_00219 [Candidatus Methanoperedenaceae archaeon GB37]|nr:hypothetical protein DMNBHIDG_00219 [Candidatus Methanoperedenaceae archaeon GB37]
MLPWLVLNWDPSHIIFLGVFYSAMGTLGLGSHICHPEKAFGII